MLIYLENTVIPRERSDRGNPFLLHGVAMRRLSAAGDADCHDQSADWSRNDVVLQQCVYKAFGFEGHQVVCLFAYANELHGDLQSVGNGDDDAALGGAVQLG